MKKFDMSGGNKILKWFLGKVLKSGQLSWNFAVSWPNMMKFEMGDGNGTLKWFFDKVLKYG